MQLTLEVRLACRHVAEPRWSVSITRMPSQEIEKVVRDCTLVAFTAMMVMIYKTPPLLLARTLIASAQTHLNINSYKPEKACNSYRKLLSTLAIPYPG